MMIKKLRFISLFLLFFTNYFINAQVVSTKEAFPNGDNEITIIVDLKLAKDGRAAGLLNKTSDIYFWSGAGDDANGNAFKYTPTGQSNFNAPYEPGKMTSLGSDKWSITIKPRTYYNVPSGTSIKKIGVVIKNGAGNAQTEDLFLELFEQGLTIKLLKPTNNIIILPEKGDFDLKLITSKKANLSVATNVTMPDNTVRTYTLAEFSNIDSLETKIKLEKINDTKIAGMTLKVIITAKTNEETTSDTLTIVVKPNVELEAKPTNTKEGINYTSKNSATVVFYAPQKSFVTISVQNLGDFLMKKDPESAHFWIELNNLIEGYEYLYNYVVDGTIVVADPFSEKILDPKFDKFISNTTYPGLMPFPEGVDQIMSVLQTGQKPFEWKGTNFKRPKSEQLVIYELLIRDFTVEGTYKAAQSRIPYLKNLGINAIELMPVSEFTANDSWGYNPTFYTAVDKAYGTKDDLKNFIDECHKNGIAVIIDMVLNQADEAFPYVKMYFENGGIAPDSPYFNQSATHPFSVFRDFNHESLATQSFVDQVNKYWLQEFNIDGFRFDLSKGFTQKINTDVGQWSNYDGSRVAIWKRIYDKIRETDKTAYVILEHFAANNEEQELSDYGMMFWGNANGDYRNSLKNGSNNLAGISHKNRGWQKANLIGYMESHDEERLMFDVQKNGGASGNYSTKDLGAALERAKAATALFLLTEGPKMIWQFGELGYDVSIDQNGRTGKKPVKWDYFDEPARKKLYQTYSEMIKLKKILDIEGATFSYDLAGKFKKITIENKDQKIVFFANFDLQNRSETIGLPLGTWYDYFTGDELAVQNNSDKYEIKPGEFHIYSSKKLTTPEVGIVPWESIKKEQILATEPLVFSNFNIYPNPSSDFIQMSFSGKTGNRYRVVLVNMSGNLMAERTGIFNNNTEKEHFTTKKLPSGTYLLKVETEGKIQTGKFSKL